MNKLTISYPFEENAENAKLLAYIQQLQRIVVTSSLGPFSKLKLISQNANFYLTNSSKYLLKSLCKHPAESSEYAKWLFDLIQQTLQLHVDGNYDLGLSTGCFLNELYILHAKNPSYQQLIELTLDELCRHVKGTECSVKLKLDLNNLKQLRCLVQSVLGTKSVYRLNFKNDSFSDLILKANLSSFCGDGEPGSGQCFSSINYLFNCTGELNDASSQLFNGVLVSAENLNNLGVMESLIKAKRKTLLKCVLIDVQLSADFEQFDFEGCKFEVLKSSDENRRNVFLLMDKIKKVCDVLVAAGVDILLCQKVIHPSIKCYLIERKCVPIDRLSITYTKDLAELTGCKVCKSAFNLEQFSDSSIYGFLSSLSVKRIAAKHYFHFENNDKSLSQTMIVCLYDEIYVDEMQHLLKVTESCFRRAILSGHLLCGGPCFYSYVICYLYKYFHSQPPHGHSKSTVYTFLLKLKSLFVNMLKHLLKHSNKLYDYQIDTDTGHLHHIQSDFCECGVFTTDSVGPKIELIESQSSHVHDFNRFLLKANSVGTPNTLDCFESRLNSMKIAQRLLTTIFRIGVFVSDKQ